MVGEVVEINYNADGQGLVSDFYPSTEIER